MRRCLVWCALFLLTAAAAAWAEPIRGGASNARLAGANLAATAPTNLRGLVLFGETAIEPVTSRVGYGRAMLLRQSDVQQGTARWISVYVARHSGARAVLGRLYVDNHGVPGALIASGSLSRPRAGSWNVIPINETAVKQGQTYWVALVARGGSLALRGAPDSSCTSTTSPSGQLGTVAASGQGAGSSQGCVLSTYVLGDEPATTTTTASPVLITLPPLDLAPAPHNKVRRWMRPPGPGLTARRRIPISGRTARGRRAPASAAPLGRPTRCSLLMLGTRSMWS
jgi:hypothetical protein